MLLHPSLWLSVMQRRQFPGRMYAAGGYISILDHFLLWLQGDLKCAAVCVHGCRSPLAATPCWAHLMRMILTWPSRKEGMLARQWMQMMS